ncbi:HopJ type III effector protein, partial [bacterium]|nr:HopJ type III effector protein [bacterium]
NGSCKLFAFAKLQGFSKEETLTCFGGFYTKDVLGNPTGDDHQNIRNFMVYGWDGIQFQQEALKEK